MLRSRRERVGYDEELDEIPSTAGLSSEVEQREDLRALLGDLAKLPDDQRSALLLSELGAHTHDDVAEVLGVKREKVKALVFQAREGLSAARTARETPCDEIREELATARGGALRRGNLRRHLDACSGCRAFREEVQRQRVAFGAILPVGPSLALQQAIFGGAAAMTAAGGGAAGAGALSTAGGVGAKAAAAKLMTVVAVAGGSTGAGYVAVHEVRHGHDVPPAVAQAAPPHAASQEAAHSEPIAQTTPLPPAAATPPTPAIRVTRTATPAARTHRAAAPKRHAGRRAHRSFASLEEAPAAAAPPAEHRRRALQAAPATVAPAAPAVVDDHGDEGGDQGKKPKHGKKVKADKGLAVKGLDKRGARKQHPPHPHGGPPGQLKRGDKPPPPGQQRKLKHGPPVGKPARPEKPGSP